MTHFGITSLGYLALNTLWIVMAIAGLVAFIRTKNLALLVQAIGATFFFLGGLSSAFLPLVLGYLMGHVGSPVRSISPVTILQLASLLTYLPGILLFTLGYCLEKFRQKPPTPAPAFPVA